MIGGWLRRASLALCAIASLAGAGCQTAGLPGAASMRVDVDVYKGPLAKDPWTQWGELVGLVRETGAATGKFRGAMDIVVAYARKKHKCPIDENGHIDPAKMVADVDGFQFAGCFFAASVSKELGEKPISSFEQLADQLQRFPHVATGPDEKELRKLLSEVGQTASQLRTKSLFWANALVAAEPSDDLVRTMVVAHASMISEYSNQVSTRADALLQQIDKIDRRELPLSLQLQNTQPTDFLNMYVWNKAEIPTSLRTWAWFSAEKAASRVRAIERLYADLNWSKVNTVYASGQGEVSMAFIKDEIGNWNLKSFGHHSELPIGHRLGSAANAASFDVAGLHRFTRQKLVDVQRRAEATERELMEQPGKAGELGQFRQRVVKQVAEILNDHQKLLAIAQEGLARSIDPDLARR